MKSKRTFASARGVALKVLTGVEMRKGQTRELLDEWIDRYSLSPKESSLAVELAYGCMLRLGTLDWILNQIGQKTQRIPPKLRNLLRIGLYQLAYLSKIPEYAAINETVNLAKTEGKKAAGFINAVLRKYEREKSGIIFPDKKEDLASYLSIVHSHPRDLVNKWISVYGERLAEEICKVDNDPPFVFARTNILKTDTEELYGLLEKEGWEVRRSSTENNVLILEKGPSLNQSRAFADGLFHIQDITAMRIAQALDPKEGEIIGDFCAAPGGKTIVVAQMMADTGKIISVENNKNRFEQLDATVKRMKIRSAELKIMDVSVVCREFGQEFFDRIILDVPCSNTGTMRRRVEARWKYSSDGVKKLVKKQKSILRHACKTLKKGGFLVYATCSIEPEENSGVINAFLEENKSFQLINEKIFLPAFEDGDGGYFARLKRIDGRLPVDI